MPYAAIVDALDHIEGVAPWRLTFDPTRSYWQKIPGRRYEWGYFGLFSLIEMAIRLSTDEWQPLLSVLGRAEYASAI